VDESAPDAGTLYWMGLFLMAMTIFFYQTMTIFDNWKTISESLSQGKVQS
jgi:hypothetical protein